MSRRRKKTGKPGFHPAARLGIALLRLLILLPAPVRRGAGRLIGRLGYRLVGSRRHITETNLRLCFPELDERQRRELAMRNFASFGQSVMENAAAFLGRVPKVAGDRIPPWLTVKNLAVLQEARAKGRGVLLVGMHLDCLDFAGSLLGQLVRLDVMYRPHKNPAMEAVIRRGRERYFDEVIERRNIRRVVRCLRQGHIIWYGPDQDYGRRHAEFVPFFGIPAATLTTTARIARITRAALVSFVHFRQAGGRYLLELHPLTQLPTDDDRAFTAALNQWIEQCVRRHPEQYLWLHKRFKTRPEGAASLYRGASGKG